MSVPRLIVGVLSLVAIGVDTPPAFAELATPFSREAFLMGTRVVLTAYADTRADGMRRLEQMLEVLEDTDAQLSTWQPDSEMSRLNRAAGNGPQRLTPTMCRMLAELGRHVENTNGAFDPAIGPLVDAWDLHGAGRVPSPRELAAARATSGWRLLTFDGGGALDGGGTSDRPDCTLEQPMGGSIDVGAFGKGEALDRVHAVLPDAAAWLVDFGGHLAVGGTPPDGEGWHVSIAHPRNRDLPAVSLLMTEGSLSTSAGSERDLRVHDRRIGHILDPRTGTPAAFDGSATVWAVTALAADALSTALHVMGPDAGTRWADAHDVAALFLEVTPDGTIQQRRSRAFSRRFGPADSPSPAGVSP